MSRDSREIMGILPHRYPMLLIDRILELEPGKRAVGYKNLTFNEEFFQGHFPGNPVMPGVLMIEALAQLGGTAVLPPGEFQRKTVYLTGVDKMKFRRIVVPGDCLMMETIVTKARANLGWVEATAKVDGKLVCSGTLMFSILVPPIGVGIDAPILHE